MAEYTGKSLVVKFSTITLPNVRRVRIDPEGAGVDREDITHAGDTMLQFLDKIPNPGREVATISALDESGATSPYKTWGGVATAGTLYVYPEGDASGKPVLSATGYLLPPRMDEGYDTVTTVELNFVTDEASEYKFTRGTVA